MKKTLFVMAALAVSAVSVAQTAVNAVKLTTLPIARNSQVCTFAVPGQKPLKTAATGNYYTRPAGSMYVGTDAEGRAYQSTLLNLSPFAEATFVNKNANPADAKWTINKQDASELADANNNLVYSISPIVANEDGSISSYYAPTLTKGTDAYTLPNNRQGGGNSGLVSVDLGMLTFAGPTMGRTIYGTSQFMSTSYLFGTGIATPSQTDQKFVIKSVSQRFEKPMSPLYVEDVEAWIISGKNNSEPLKNGAKVTMTITADDGTQIATITADANDINKLGDQTFNDETMGVVHPFGITFTNKVEDPVSHELIASPFVIDKPFTVTVTGFDQPGVDFSFYGFMSADEDVLDKGVLLGYPQGGDVNKLDSISYSGNLSIPFNFKGLMDYVSVESKLTTQNGQSLQDCNIIRISDDGQTNTFDKHPEAGNAAAFVVTGTNWLDGSGNERYYYEVESSSDGDGSWITGMNVDNSAWVQEGRVQGVNYVNFTAEPVSAGQGKWAVLRIVGRGVTSSTPIILLQGTAKDTDGIKDLVNKKFDANAPVYNVAGQRVSKSTKGLLIQNGKKFVNK